MMCEKYKNMYMIS